MNLRIAQSKVLTTPFDRRRIVFWYDAKQEPIEEFETRRLPDAQIPNIAFRTKLTAHKSHLDDGVKANYPKFGAALKKIVGLDAVEN